MDNGTDHSDTFDEPKEENCTNGNIYFVPTPFDRHDTIPNGKETKELYMDKEFSSDTDNSKAEKFRPRTPSIDSSISASKSEQKDADRQNGPNLKSRMIGFLLGSIASLIVAVSAACVQGLQGAVPDFQLATMRGLFTFIAVAPVYVIKREAPRVPKRLWLWLFIYSMLGAVYHMTQYIAIRIIPLGVSGCILRTVLMVSVTLMARLVLKELLTVVKLMAVVISILGTFLVIQPEGIFNNVPDDESVGNTTSSNSTSPESGDTVDQLEDVYGYLLTCVAGFCASSITIIQKAKLGELAPTILNFYPAIAKTIVPVVAFLIFEDFAFPSDAVMIILVLTQSVAAAVTNILVKRAIHMTTAILFSLALSMQVMFLLVAQYTVLKDIQPGVGNWVEIFGAAVVTFAAVIPPAWEFVEEKFNLQPPELKSCRRSQTYPVGEP